MPALFIITGTTRGIGAALARFAVDAGHRVIGLSRSTGAAGETIICDLANTTSLPARIEQILSPEVHQSIDRFILVNNAAVLTPIGGNGDPREIDEHFRVNLTAPVVLARAFIVMLQGHPAPKRIINLSSGAASRAFDGWSAYCASKAGLDHFGRCLALEQSRATHPVDVLAFSPGVVDTGMQAQIRASDSETFPDVARFHELQASGALADPDKVAAVLLAAALSDRAYAGTVLRVDEIP